MEQLSLSCAYSFVDESDGVCMNRLYALRLRAERFEAQDILDDYVKRRRLCREICNDTWRNVRIADHGFGGSRWTSDCCAEANMQT